MCQYDNEDRLLEAALDYYTSTIIDEIEVAHDPLRRVMDRLRNEDMIRVDYIEDGRGSLKYRFNFLIDPRQALASMAPNDALTLLETADLEDLYGKVRVFNHLADASTPLYSLYELIDLLCEVKNYLIANKDPLITTGCPNSKFIQSLWLHDRLANLYCTRLSFDSIVTQVNSGARKGDSQQDAPLVMEGMSRNAAKRIESERERILDLKLAIIDHLISTLTTEVASVTIDDDALTAWQNCIYELKKAFTGDSIMFWLDIDRKRYNFVGSSCPVEGRDYLKGGGITDLFNVIRHIDEEIEIGFYSECLKSLGSLASKIISPSQSRIVSRNYFALLAERSTKEFDLSFRMFESLLEKRWKYLEGYELQVNQTLDYLFDVKVNIAQWIEPGMIADFQKTKRLLRNSAKSVVNHTLAECQVRSVNTDPLNPSTDYRSVIFHGILYSLTSYQSRIIKVLHEAYQNDTPELGQQAVLTEIESKCNRVRDVFGNVKLFKVFIRRGASKGSIRLNT